MGQLKARRSDSTTTNYSSGSALEKGARESEKDYDSLNKILFIPTSYDEDLKPAIVILPRNWGSFLFH